MRVRSGCSNLNYADLPPPHCGAGVMGPAQGLRHRCSQHLEAMYLQATECTPAPPTCGLAAAALRPRAGCRAHISAWAAATWGWTAGAGPVGWRVQADAGDGDGRLYTKLRPVSRALLPGRNMAGEGGVAWSLWGLNEVWCGACMAYARVCVCAFARARPPPCASTTGGRCCPPSSLHQHRRVSYCASRHPPILWSSSVSRSSTSSYLQRGRHTRAHASFLSPSLRTASTSTKPRRWRMSTSRP